MKTQLESIVGFMIRHTEEFTEMSTPEAIAMLEAEFPGASTVTFAAAFREAARRDLAHADELERYGKSRA